MDDTDGDIAAAPRSRLYRLVTQLLHAHEKRDRLAQESGEAEQEMEAVPADLLDALSDAEHALLTLEVEVLEAAYAVIAADQLNDLVQRDEDQT